MRNRKPYKNYLIVTTTIEGDCYRAKVIGKSGQEVYDTYWRADEWGVPATRETAIAWAQQWIDLLD